MKKIKFMILALVAMCGFSACSEDCDHNFIEVDYSKDIVGTWTVLEPEHSAAYIFNADGTLSTTGFDGEEYWEDVKGTYSVVNNKITIKFETGRNINGSFDIIPGQSISIVGEKGRHTYNYCEEDLSDEIVGMWVCNDGLPGVENDMGIKTFTENGKMALTTPTSEFINKDFVNVESDYKVIGNLLFMMLPKQNVAEGKVPYLASQLTYIPNGTSLGDILVETSYVTFNDGDVIYSISSWLRIKQGLDLPGQKYDYIKTFVSNVKGEDKDIEFMGYTFNFAKMDGSGLDKMLKAILFNVEFQSADTLCYSYQYNNNVETFKAPIEVDGNKMTIKMSKKVPTLKDVVLYTFQDADCSQMHFYMHKTAFVNFYTNMQAMLLAGTDEQFDITDANAVNAIYNTINDAVETINVSLVMSKSK
jgi:hypothetical protein